MVSVAIEANKNSQKIFFSSDAPSWTNKHSNLNEIIILPAPELQNSYFTYSKQDLTKID